MFNCFKPELWIWIHWFLIRNFKWIRIHIQSGSRVLMTKNWRKNTAEKFGLTFFKSKIAIFLCLRYRRNFQPSKENIQHFKKGKFINFFLCLWVIFALLDPDCESGYASREPIAYGSITLLQTTLTRDIGALGESLCRLFSVLLVGETASWQSTQVLSQLSFYKAKEDVTCWRWYNYCSYTGKGRCNGCR